MNKENISPHFATSHSLSFYCSLTTANRVDISLATHTHKITCGTKTLVKPCTWRYIQYFLLVMSWISSFYSGII